MLFRSEVPRLLHRFDVGVTVPEGDAAALAHVIRTLRDNPHMRQGMGVRARQAFERHWDRPIALGQWQKVLEGVLLRAGSSSQASQSILPVGGAPTPEQSPSSRAL